ncbi:hypothetical protein CDO52_07175 [Nocardiopsis gilva YIM 90087]|uniref:Uncharacterized protein n=1 Tax=Nocardiopsis gilva YIM 90087 TaxID=1235441 RepID=A0A223S3E3_9ACTN|nr:hypothetical protein CDO52_07175 [Nocardiopsis gilva YIM 90087]
MAGWRPWESRSFEVSVVGEKHHCSHPDVPPVDNVGFLDDVLAVEAERAGDEIRRLRLGERVEL